MEEKSAEVERTAAHALQMQSKVDIAYALNRQMQTGGQLSIPSSLPPVLRTACQSWPFRWKHKLRVSVACPPARMPANNPVALCVPCCVWQSKMSCAPRWGSSGRPCSSLVKIRQTELRHWTGGIGGGGWRTLSVSAVEKVKHGPLSISSGATVCCCGRREAGGGRREA